VVIIPGIICADCQVGKDRTLGLVKACTGMSTWHKERKSPRITHTQKKLVGGDRGRQTLDPLSIRVRLCGDAHYRKKRGSEEVPVREIRGESRSRGDDIHRKGAGTVLWKSNKATPSRTLWMGAGKEGKTNAAGLRTRERKVKKDGSRAWNHGLFGKKDQKKKRW